MDCFLLQSNLDVNRLLEDLKIATDICCFINPEKINGKTFSLSRETYGWEAIPLHTLNGLSCNDSLIPLDVTKHNNFLPNNILKKCNYIQKILDSLNTEIYLVRIMKLKIDGYIAPHVDKLIDNKNVIRCQIPIITDEKVDFVIDNKKYKMDAGNLYFINVGEKIHWVKNNSDKERITLVIDMKPSDKIKKKIDI